MRKLRTISIWLLTVIRSFVRHENRTRAAAIAFFAMFSFVPLLVLIFSIAALLIGEKSAEVHILNQIQAVFGPLIANMSAKILKQPIHNLFSSFISIVLLLFSASLIFKELKLALNNIWEIKSLAKTGREKIFENLQDYVLSFILLPFFGLAFLLSIIFRLIIRQLSKYFELINIPMDLVQFSEHVFTTLLIFIFVLTLMRFVPSWKITYQNLMIASFITTVLLELGQIFITTYLQYTTIPSFYAAAGSLVAILIWVYFSAQIFLLGAEVAKYLEDNNV